MMGSVRVAVLYASDFCGYSPGGIQQFVRRVGEIAPMGWSIDYFGVGVAPGDVLPRPQDRFVSVVPTPARGKLNSQFLRGLFTRRKTLAAYDIVIAHRPEYLAAVPAATKRVLVLHGGTWNAWKTGRRTFGVAYAAAELLAVARSATVLSVCPQDLGRLSSLVCRSVQFTRVPGSEEFHHFSSGAAQNSRLVTACRLVPEKRVEVLIALAAKTGLILDVYGDGPCRNDLVEYAREVAATVHFHGAVTTAELAHEYSNGGAFCMASTFEGYPLAAVEAAIAGLQLVEVASSAMRQLTEIGVNRFADLTSAAAFFRGAWPSQTDASLAWDLHSPASVGSAFWSAIKDA